MPSSKAEHFFLTFRSPEGPLLLPPPSHTPSSHPAGQHSAPWAHQADGVGGVQRGLGWEAAGGRKGPEPARCGSDSIPPLPATASTTRGWPEQRPATFILKRQYLFSSEVSYRRPGGSADKPRVHELLTLLPRWERKGTQASEPRTALRFRLCCGNPSSLGRTGSSLWPPTPPASSACGEWERVLGVQGLIVIGFPAAGPGSSACRLQDWQHTGSVLAAHRLSCPAT